MKAEVLETPWLLTPPIPRINNLFQEEIRESLKRCSLRNAGNNTNLPRHKGEKHNKQVVKELYTSVITPFLNFLIDDDLAILLTDKYGNIIDLRGSSKAISKLQESGITINTNLSEEIAGTNAFALSLILKKPMCVIGSQHYKQQLKEWSSFSAPICNTKGDIEGLTGLWRFGLKYVSYRPYLLSLFSLVTLIANIINKEWYVREIEKELAFQKGTTEALADCMDGVLAIDCNHVIKYVSPMITNHFKKNIIGHKLDALGKKELVDLVEADSNVNKEVCLTGTSETKVYIATAKPIKGPKTNQQFGHLIILAKSKDVRNHKTCTTHFTFNNIIGNSFGLKKAVEMAKAAAGLDVRVLLEGESGTGKELFAQAIHNESGRRHGPFVAVNCSAIPRELFESEFFGYTEGAFTGAKKGGKPGKFELANGGTLFLDEICSLPWDMQAKLLRALQQNEIMRVGGNEVIPINVRIIAASNKPLQELVTKGEFRQDLFYRLNVVAIRIPPLRERVEDIPVLCEYLIAMKSKKLGKPISGIDTRAMEVLCAYHWPGNVRELENCIERAITLAKDNTIRVEDLPTEILVESTKGKNECSSIKEPSEPKSLKTLEKESILQSLIRFNGNISKASKALGISRTTLYKKIREYDIRIR